MKRTVRTWQENFPLGEFCRRLGIPEDEAPYLLTMYAEVFGVSATFIQPTGEHESEQWDRHWWSKRAFCKALGLPGEWSKSLTNFSVNTYEETVEVRFVL
jgi:hypothetical protein